MTIVHAAAGCGLVTARHHRERGAATLIVVMVLFFVMSMVAAYTSRNLIFEQKTSANQLRSTQAAEAAEAGMQWALGLLNSGRIDNACLPSANLANTSFRQRYLRIDDGTGTVVPLVPPVPGAVAPVTKADGSDLTPSCVFNGITWNCSCPVNGDPAVVAPAGTAISPAFRVRFRSHAARPRLVWVEVNGCTAYQETCLKFVDGQGADSEGRAFATALLTIKGAVTSAPSAALTARTTVSLVPGTALNVYNTNPKWSGVTIQAGGAVTQDVMNLKTVSPSPGPLSVVQNDPTLQFADFLAAGKSQADAMFVATFGMQRTTYRDQPGALVLTCGACTATDVRAAADQNPGRIIWVPGNLTFDGVGDVGSATEPLAIVATGNVTFASDINVYGLVYSQAAAWATGGGPIGTIVGAAMGESSIGGTWAGSVAYDSAVLDLLRYRTGSFVIVPGTWKDF